MTQQDEANQAALDEAVEELHGLVRHLGDLNLAQAVLQLEGTLFAEGHMLGTDEGKMFPLEGKAGYSLSIGIMRAAGYADDSQLDVIYEITHTAAATKDRRPAFTFAKRTGSRAWRGVITHVECHVPSSLLNLAELVGMRPHDGSVELDHEHLLIGLKRSVAIFATGD